MVNPATLKLLATLAATVKPEHVEQAKQMFFDALVKANDVVESHLESQRKAAPAQDSEPVCADATKMQAGPQADSVAEWISSLPDQDEIMEEGWVSNETMNQWMRSGHVVFEHGVLYYIGEFGEDRIPLFHLATVD